MSTSTTGEFKPSEGHESPLFAVKAQAGVRTALCKGSQGFRRALRARSDCQTLGWETEV